MSQTTLYLDPATWDLALDSSGSIALADTPYSLAQDAASAIRTFAGECWYDTTIGLPYWTEILGHAPPLDLMRQAFIDAAMSVPGVVSAQVFLTSANRIVSGQVQITDSTGTVTAASF